MDKSENRIVSLDLARSLAILFMVMVHVLEWHGTTQTRTSLLGEIIEFFGGAPAAPVFTFLMGIVLFLSSRATLSKSIRRSAQLLGLAYLLNALRGTLPLSIGLHLGILSQNALGPFTPISAFWLVDILQFAGLALLFLTTLRHLKVSPISYLVLAGIVAFISPSVWGNSKWQCNRRLVVNSVVGEQR